MNDSASNTNYRKTWDLYARSWQVTDGREREALYAQCLAEDCQYTDPSTQTKGWKALGEYMAEFQKQVPGGYFVMSDFMAHHQRSIAHWQLLAADDSPLGTGVSYGEYDKQGKLVSMNGFFEAPGQ